MFRGLAILLHLKGFKGFVWLQGLSAPNKGKGISQQVGGVRVGGWVKQNVGGGSGLVVVGSKAHSTRLGYVGEVEHCSRNRWTSGKIYGPLLEILLGNFI